MVHLLTMQYSYCEGTQLKECMAAPAYRTHFFLPTLSHNLDFCLTWILVFYLSAVSEIPGNSRGDNYSFHFTKDS